MQQTQLSGAVVRVAVANAVGHPDSEGHNLFDEVIDLGRSEAHSRIVAAAGDKRHTRPQRLGTLAYMQPLSARETRSLLLHTLVAARLLADPGPVLTKAHANLYRRSQRELADTYWLGRWHRLLELPPAVLALLLTERSEDAADLRRHSPFAGVLAVEERRAVFEACEALR